MNASVAGGNVEYPISHRWLRGRSSGSKDLAIFKGRRIEG
jgi:hypothetical protein